MMQALNTCKTLQITPLPFLACITVYTTVFIFANSKPIYIVNLISVLVIYHKQIWIFHQAFLLVFFQVRSGGITPLFGSQGRAQRTGSDGIYALSCLFSQSDPRYKDR